MDPNADPGTNLPKSLTREHGFEHELLSPDTPHETDSGIISVQVLEFKTCLLEAVEELHIRRDAETRYEAQISKLVLEKQELEWQKESLQHQIDTMSNEHTQSLAAVKKQFQARIRGIEGEKGKHQLTAELRDKEITSLKEELKLLQLFKYSLEKKLSELEQKLQLQTQTKDSHLNQLGEVEKRFGVVSRQCAMVKQAHEKLEQNVEEAMRLNKKLTSVNKKQESTINYLKQDVEKLNNELIKAKVSSVCRSGDENSYLAVKEQQMQQLQHRLHVETELNKKLRNENAAGRAEKQEVMSSLQHAQQLLQTQTHALSRAELQLHAHTEEYQALKREHELIQEKTKEKEDRFAHLMEECKNSKIMWEQEKRILQERMQAELEELKSVKEAYDCLHEKHKQLSSCAILQAEHIQGLESGLKDRCKDNGNFVTELSAGDAPYESKNVFLEDEIVSVQDSSIQRNDKDAEGMPDKSSDAGHYQETVRDEAPQRENCEVIICAQTSHGKGPQSQGSQGTGEPCPSADQAKPVLQPPGRLDALASLQSGRSLVPDNANAAVTNQLTDSNGKRKLSVGESEPVYSPFNNGCSSGVVQRDKEDRISRLSGSENRSVYGVDGDLEALKMRDREQEQTVCIPETREAQTSDKHRDSQKCTPSRDTDSEEVKDQTSVPESPQLCTLLPMDRDDNAETVRDDTDDGLSTLAAAVQESEPHTENPVQAQDLNVSHSTSQHLKLSQQNYSAHNVAQPSASLNCGSDSKEPEDQHLQTVRDCVPVTEEALDHDNPQQTLPENSRHDVSTDAKAYHMSEPRRDISIDSVSSNTSSSQRSVIAIGSPESTSSDEAHYTDTAHGENVKDQQSDVEITHKASTPQKPEPQDVAEESLPKDNQSKPNDTLEADDKQIVEMGPSFASGNKRYRSSFELGMFTQEKREVQLRGSQGNAALAKVSQGSHDTSMSSASLRSSTKEEKTPVPSGFHEHPSPLSIPLFQKDKLNKRDSTAITRTADMLNPSSVHPHHKRDQQGEWNAIKQTFCEISAEKESRVPISFSSTVPSTSASLSVGNGLRPDCTPSRSISPLRHHSYGKVTKTVSEGLSSSSEKKEGHQQSDIRAQIARIEQFLSSEGFRLPKRRKTEECEVVKL